MTLTSGLKAFTTSGANMLTRGHLAGDSIIHPNGKTLVIATITGENAGTLEENCPSDCSGSGINLRIRFQPDGSRVTAQARNLIDAVSTLTAQLVAPTSSVAGYLTLLEATANGTNKVTISPVANLTADRLLTTPDADLAFSSFIATLVDDADAVTARGTLGALGGSTGSTDRSILIANGTGGSTAQAITAVTIASNGSITDNGSAANLTLQPNGDTTGAFSISPGTGTTTINKASATSAGFDFNAFPGDGTSASTTRFNRSTNTSGTVSVQFLRGNGANTPDHTFYGNGGYVCGGPTGGNKGVGAINAQNVYDDNSLLTCIPMQEQFLKEGKVDSPSGMQWCRPLSSPR